MRTKTFTLLLLCFWSINLLQAQSFPVTLKVIDKTKGAKTNANDHVESNVICEIDDNLKAQNPRDPAPSDWWFPMYNSSEAVADPPAVTPDGNLIKSDDSWSWEITFNALPGDYGWNPNMKSLWWQTMNGNISGVAWEGKFLQFSVSETGEITGTTEITVDYLATIVLQIIDETKGADTNGEGDLHEKNIYVWAEQNTNGDWWLPLYSHPTHGTKSELIKSDESWIWQTTLYTDNPGTYRWNPYIGDVASGTMMIDVIENADWPADAAANGLSYTIAADGTVTGTTALRILALPNSIVGEKTDNGVRFKFAGDNLQVSGAKNSVDLYNASGVKVAKQVSSSNATIDMSSFSKGVYILVVDGKHSYKLMK